MHIITGTSGKVGKAICKRFNKKKPLLLLKFTSNPNIFSIKKKKNEYELICNYFKIKNLKKIIGKFSNIQGVIHAGWGGVNEPNDEKIHKKNYQNSKILFNFFYKSTKINFFLFIGSIDQYGNSKNVNYDVENLGKTKLKRPYEFYKQKLTKYILKSNKKKISLIIIILSNVIGKPHQKNSIINYFKNCIKNKNIPEINSNKFYRNFILSIDVSLYIEKLLTNIKTKKNYLLNMGNDNSFRIDLFNKSLWKQISNSKPIKFKQNDTASKDYLRNKFFLNIKNLNYITGLNLSKNKSSLLNKLKKII